MRAKCTLPLALLLLAIAAPVAGAHAGTVKVRSVSAPRSATAGASTTVDVTVARRGRTRAAAVGFYLSANAKRDGQDVRLKGAAKVAKGRRSGTSRLGAELKIPAGQALGELSRARLHREELRRLEEGARASPRCRSAPRSWWTRRSPPGSSARSRGSCTAPSRPSATAACRPPTRATTPRTRTRSCARWRRAGRSCRARSAGRSSRSSLRRPRGAAAASASAGTRDRVPRPACPTQVRPPRLAVDRARRTVTCASGGTRPIRRGSRRGRERCSTEADDTIWRQLWPVFGRDPVTDEHENCFHGGDGKLDIYLVNRTDGTTKGETIPYPGPCSGHAAHTSSSTPAASSPTRWELAHELTHAFQFAFPVASCSSFANFDEAVATWGGQYVYPRDDRSTSTPGSRRSRARRSPTPPTTAGCSPTRSSTSTGRASCRGSTSRARLSTAMHAIDARRAGRSREGLPGVRQARLEPRPGQAELLGVGRLRPRARGRGRRDPPGAGGPGRRRAARGGPHAAAEAALARVQAPEVRAGHHAR